MLLLRHPPDFAALAAHADAARTDPQFRPPGPLDRRKTPRRAVHAAIYLGVVPAACEHLRLNRIPVSVFKPLDAGWAIDLSTQGVALLTAKPLEVGQRHWLRLDHIAHRPTIVPARVVGCVPFDQGVFHARFAFLLDDASVTQRLGFVELDQVA